MLGYVYGDWSFGGWGSIDIQTRKGGRVPEVGPWISWHAFLQNNKNNTSRKQNLNNAHIKLAMKDSLRCQMSGPAILQTFSF